MNSRIDLILRAQDAEARCDRLADLLREFLKDEGAHSVGCKEYPPGFDDSRCCRVHMARAALAELAKESGQ